MSKNPTTQEKFETVISKTFFRSHPNCKNEDERRVLGLQQILLSLKDEIDKKGFKKEILEDLLLKSKEGLTALLILTGISNETLKRLITLIIIIDNDELSKVVYRKKWMTGYDKDNLEAWSDERIAIMIKNDQYFRKGLVNLLCDGASIECLRKTLPLFEFKKLTSQKFNFEPENMIDTLVRYNLKLA